MTLTDYLADQAGTIRGIVPESEAVVLTSIEALEAGRLLFAAKADCRHERMAAVYRKGWRAGTQGAACSDIAGSGLKSDTVSDLRGALEFIAARGKAVAALGSANTGMASGDFCGLEAMKTYCLLCLITSARPFCR